MVVLPSTYRKKNRRSWRTILLDPLGEGLLCLLGTIGGHSLGRARAHDPTLIEHDLPQRREVRDAVVRRRLMRVWKQLTVATTWTCPGSVDSGKKLRL